MMCPLRVAAVEKAHLHGWLSPGGVCYSQSLAGDSVCATHCEEG